AWQLGKNYRSDAAVWGDPRATLAELADRLAEILGPEHAEARAARVEQLARRRADVLAAVDRQTASESGRRARLGAAGEHRAGLRPARPARPRAARRRRGDVYRAGAV